MRYCEESLRTVRSCAQSQAIIEQEKLNRNTAFIHSYSSQAILLKRDGVSLRFTASAWGRCNLMGIPK